MNLENLEKKQTMTESEINLWEELSIPYFIGRLGTIRGVFSQMIIEEINEGNKERAKEILANMEEACESLISMIEKIDITHFDDKFPLDLIKSLIGEGPGALNKVLKLYKSVVEQNNNISESEFLRKIKEETDFLVKLSEKFEKNPKYIEFRKCTEHIG